MTTGFTRFDYECMARALRLARRGWYTAHPNPRVGCVIARGDAILGEGWHRRTGEPHAEVNALAAAGELARGATAYVSLEPCNHRGRTGPCARALIDAGIVEVVYGMADPHPAAAGGLAILRDAGVRVRGPLLENDARAVNPGFIRRFETGQPRVTVKLAMSLDGRTAMASGESQWITGPPARRDVQCLRAESGAVITGSGTVLADDPALTVRENLLPLDNAAEICRRQPLRVVVDSRSRTPGDARLLAQDGEVLIATAGDDRAYDHPSVTVSALPGASGRVDLAALLGELGRRECNDVLVEAGPELAGAFVRAELVDRLVVYMAPKLLGDRGRPLLALPFDRMAQSLGMQIQDIRPLGADWRITATPEKQT